MTACGGSSESYNDSYTEEIAYSNSGTSIDALNDLMAPASVSGFSIQNSYGRDNAVRSSDKLSSAQMDGGATEGDAENITDEQKIQKKIIRNVEMNVMVDSSDMMEYHVYHLKEDAESLGGYVVSSSVDYGTYRTYGNLLVKVPQDKVDGFIQNIKDSELKITRLDDNSTDVTTQYVDIDARLKVKEIQKAKYEEYLTKAETVEELLAIEKELNSLIEEIEASKSRLQAIDLDVDYTDVRICIESKEALEKESFGSRLAEGLKGAGNNLLDAFLNVLDSLSYIAIPLVVYFGIFVAFAMVFVKAIRKAWGKRANKLYDREHNKRSFKIWHKDREDTLENKEPTVMDDDTASK